MTCRERFRSRFLPRRKGSLSESYRHYPTTGGLARNYNVMMNQICSDTVLCQLLRTLRRSLNACAEPAGHEAVTSRVVANFLKAYTPDNLLTRLGGYGVAAVFDGHNAGPTVLFRSELDGLPVEQHDSSASTQLAAHRCGHDGHMAMVAGLAPLLSQRRPETGRVVLLFQPAEETGEGARAILESPCFPTIAPDVTIGLHNLPGFARNKVVYRHGTFASASGGLRIQFHGVGAHAAEPELGRSPSGVLSRLLAELPELSDLTGDPYRLVTVTHVQMGIESFGLTPGDATLCATLRSTSAEGLASLCEVVEARVRAASIREGVDTEIRRVEWFPETRNDPSLVDVLRQCCAESSLAVEELETPFRWAEDFGHFSRVSRTLFFGLGIGENAHGLHQPDYVFPDDVILTGLEVYQALLRKLTDAT